MPMADGAVKGEVVKKQRFFIDPLVVRPDYDESLPIWRGIVLRLLLKHRASLPTLLP